MCAVAPQLYARVTNQPRKCKPLFVVLFIFALLVYFCHLVEWQLQATELRYQNAPLTEEEEANNVTKNGAGVAVWPVNSGAWQKADGDLYDDVGWARWWIDVVSGAILVGLLCTARQRIRERDNIPGTQCEDFLLSCCPCTQCCTAAQLLRHEGLDEGKYQLCADTGSDTDHPRPPPAQGHVPMAMAQTMGQPAVAVAQPMGVQMAVATGVPVTQPAVPVAVARPMPVYGQQPEV